MAELARFYGIIVALFFRGEFGKHKAPHVHVEHAEHSASIRISDGAVLAGYLPPKILKRAQDWIEEHRSELEAAWEIARSGKNPGRIITAKRRKNPTPVRKIAKQKGLPRINVCEWIGKNEVRLIFSNGKIIELELPWVRSAKNAKITTRGLGLDPGDGLDVSAWMLQDDAWRRAAKVRGRVLRKALR